MSRRAGWSPAAIRSRRSRPRSPCRRCPPGHRHRLRAGFGEGHGDLEAAALVLGADVELPAFRTVHLVRGIGAPRGVREIRFVLGADARDAADAVRALVHLSVLRQRVRDRSGARSPSTKPRSRHPAHCREWPPRASRDGTTRRPGGDGTCLPRCDPSRRCTVDASFRSRLPYPLSTVSPSQWAYRGSQRHKRARKSRTWDSFANEEYFGRWLIFLAQCAPIRTRASHPHPIVRRFGFEIEPGSASVSPARRPTGEPPEAATMTNYA